MGEEVVTEEQPEDQYAGHYLLRRRGDDNRRNETCYVISIQITLPVYSQQPVTSLQAKFAHGKCNPTTTLDQYRHDNVKA